MKERLDSFFHSLRKNRKGISLMLISSVFACLGQLFWKISASSGLIYLLLGLLFYAVGAVFMLMSYRLGSLSVLQPMLSLSYVLSIILAALFLDEPVTVAKAAGVLLIILGVILIGGGEKDD